MEILKIRKLVEVKKDSYHPEQVGNLMRQEPNIRFSRRDALRK